MGTIYRKSYLEQRQVLPSIFINSVFTKNQSGYFSAILRGGGAKSKKDAYIIGSIA